MTYKDYVQAAWDGRSQSQFIDLDYFATQARKGTKALWKELGSTRFINQCLWCIGSIQKPAVRHDKYFSSQIKLFRQCSTKRIVRDAAAIRHEWSGEKRDLNEKMVSAVIYLAGLVENEGWKQFKDKFLLLPTNPDSDAIIDWEPAWHRLQEFPQVGEAIAWMLLRNLYYAPVFKPDIHIKTIAAHYFGRGRWNRELLTEMTAQTKKIWPDICQDERVLPAHMGFVDLLLWDHRSRTGEP